MTDYWALTDAERTAYTEGRLARQSDPFTALRPPRHYRENIDMLTAWIDGYHDEDELLTEEAA